MARRTQLRIAVVVGCSLLLARCSDSTGTASPAIDSVSPSTGPLGGGTAITIIGRNLSSVTSVKIGGQEIVDRQVVSPNRITGKTPLASGAGAKDVVATAGSGHDTRCTACFTYIGLDVVAISSIVSSVTGGENVTISGIDFTDITSVTIGGVELANRTLVSSSQITGTAPPLAVGSKDLVVTSSSNGSDTCVGCMLYMTTEALSATLGLGGYHACHVNAGAASCWGNNGTGQLGNGSTTNADSSVAVSGGIAWQSITGGGGHSCGLSTGGATYCWGANAEGQLGNGGTTPSTVPVSVAGGTTLRTLKSGGGAHNCGLDADGQAWCWGYRLGNGSASNTSAPAVVSSLRFSFVAVGGGTCGLRSSGAAYCWGPNNSGQLGNGTTTDSPTPVVVSGGLTFVDITVGSTHACGLTSSGAAYCWGENHAGQLGTGNSAGSYVPVPVTGGFTFVAITAGFMHTCGIVTTGAIYCWGFNQEGQLGDGSNTARLAPVAVLGGLRFDAIAAGGQFTCGLSAGATYCWGADRYGQIGNGKEDTWTPAPVVNLGPVASLHAGPYGNYSCALTSAGAAWCWGEDNGGPLGRETGGNSPTPAPVTGGFSFTRLAPARSHNCGLTSSGAAYCWGFGLYGELGTGSTVYASSTPIAVTGGLTFTDIAVGVDHTCGLTTTGAAYCWGENRLGQLGDGSPATTTASSPVPVSGGHVFSAISAGIWHTCGLEGTAVYCWGTIVPTYGTPTLINPGQPFVSIASGGWHSCALTSTGAAYCWGWGRQGELGNGIFDNASDWPVPVSGGLSFASLTVGNEHTCGLTTAGATYCWGNNVYGQVGRATPARNSVPVALTTDPGFSALSAGQDHVCGITSAGTASCWGDDYFGQLGRGTFGFATAPVLTK